MLSISANSSENRIQIMCPRYIFRVQDVLEMDLHTDIVGCGKCCAYFLEHYQMTTNLPEILQESPNLVQLEEEGYPAEFQGGGVQYPGIER